MLKFIRPIRRAKKIGVLNFFLLLIIVIILGFSFLFIHEDSYSLKHHLFISDQFYALKDSPLKIKRITNSEPLKLFDIISSDNFKKIVGNNFKNQIDKSEHCRQLFFSDSDREWLKKISFKMAAQNTSCLANINHQGVFLPWFDNIKNSSTLSVELSSVCLKNSVISLSAPFLKLDQIHFQSSFSEIEALKFMQLNVVEIQQIECLQ